MILNVTLLARKVTIEERKQLKTTQVTPSYKVTVVLRWFVSGPKLMVVSIVILNEVKHKMFKSVVFIVRHRSLGLFPLLLQFFKLLFFIIFNLLFLKPFAEAMFDPGPYTTTLHIPVSDWEKKPLKQYGTP